MLINIFISIFEVAPNVLLSMRTNLRADMLNIGDNKVDYTTLNK